VLRLVRNTLPWTGPAMAAGVAALLQRSSGGDGSMFVAAGHTLLSADWSHAFAKPNIQVGPLQLALFGSVGRSDTALAVVLAVATALLLVAATKAVGVGSPALLGAVGLLAVAVGFTRVGYEVGHPADAVLPLLWIIAAVEARRGRGIRAGLLVGLSAGLETWGLLGIAVVALAPSRRAAGTGALVSGLIASALFLPFVLAGHFAMDAYHWHVSSPAPLSLVVGSGTAFGWPFRVAQGAVAVGAGIVAARALRRSPHALWVVPLAVVAARLLLDPVLLSYYLSALQGTVFVGAALLASQVIVLRRVRRESFA
jgi:hypothetical protein